MNDLASCTTNTLRVHASLIGCAEYQIIWYVDTMYLVEPLFYNQACRLPHDIYGIYLIFITLDYLFELISKRKFLTILWNLSTNHHKILALICPCLPCCRRVLKTNFISNQHCVSVIDLRKCFMKFIHERKKCSVALPHSAVGWSAVCDCGIFLIILTSFLCY